MERFILGGKEFAIRNFCEDDLRSPEKFLAYINNIADDPSAMISIREKKTLEQEKEWLIDMLSIVKISKMVLLVVEFDDLIVGGAEVSLCPGCQEHVAEFSISIIKDYRGIGLGSYLLPRIIDMAEKSLRPNPKIIRLTVFSSNKHAIALYHKYGFETVACIPNQFEFDGQIVDEIIMLKFI